MDSTILEAINYVNKTSKKKVTADVSNYLCDTGTHNIDNDSIIETLKEMQNKGLIKKLNRPIEASNTTSKTPQSIPSQSKTPPAEENHCITINDSINKSIPSSLNRSLPATPIVKPNTTPRVLSTGNSSLNTKLEGLETKLCGKIMAMKSYFMDELRSLKQEPPVTKKRNYSQDETTALKNRLKLLELENQLLKYYFSIKQKFIDTIVEHNSNPFTYRGHWCPINLIGCNFSTICYFFPVSFVITLY